MSTVIGMVFTGELLERISVREIIRHLVHSLMQLLRKDMASSTTVGRAIHPDTHAE